MMEQTENTTHKSSCLGKICILFCLLLAIIVFIAVAATGWGYYELTQTNDLAVYASKKLSRAGRYELNIEHFKNTLPLITAEGLSYKKISDVSTFTVNAKELTIYPDYSALRIGTHSFLLNGATLYLKNRNFMVDSRNITLSGKYNPENRQVVIASSTFDAFRGKLFISGNIDTTKRPNAYDLTSKLIYVRLEDILEGTKHKGLFTGDVYGDLRLFTHGGQRKEPLNGEASLTVTNGTYSKPELFEKVCNALHKVGLRSKLEGFASDIASGPFSLNGDFIIENNSYKTDNCFINLKFGKIRFSGVIGPKSALNGTFIVNIKDYSSFEVKANGPDNKHMKYEISDSDKARIASIILREAGKSAEASIKAEGKRFNRRMSDSFKDAYEDAKDATHDIGKGTSKALKKIGDKVKGWFK